MLQRFFTSIVFVASALCVVSSFQTAHAEVVEFPEDELAKESVLPVFDKTVVVRERAITTAGKFEIGAGLGLNLVEPLYEQLVYNFSASYHIDEIHGVNVTAYMLSTGLSKAGTDLKNGVGLSGNQFDASLAPQVENMIFGNYQFTAYYGKISITNQTTMNLGLYGLLGAGLLKWTDKASFGLDAGIGQKIYFTKNLSLRVDLTVMLYQGPDPTSPKSGAPLNTVELKTSDFESTYYIRPFLTSSLVYMF